jgi:hypothetical protein
MTQPSTHYVIEARLDGQPWSPFWSASEADLARQGGHLYAQAVYDGIAQASRGFPRMSYRLIRRVYLDELLAQAPEPAAVCICEGRGGHVNPQCRFYGTDQDGGA